MDSFRTPNLRPNVAGRRAQVTGLLLCGGASRRMGRDKAVLQLGGTSLLERAVQILEPLCGEVLLGCGPVPRYAETGLRLALDTIPGAGPLAGLAAGLTASETPWVLALACDLPALDVSLLETLLERALFERADVTMYETVRGPEPLCAVYNRGCLTAVNAALARGERRMVSFQDDENLKVTRIQLESWGPLLNVNTPADLVRAREGLNE